MADSKDFEDRIDRAMKTLAMAKELPVKDVMILRIFIDLAIRDLKGDKGEKTEIGSG